MLQNPLVASSIHFPDEFLVFVPSTLLGFWDLNVCTSQIDESHISVCENLCFCPSVCEFCSPVSLLEKYSGAGLSELWAASCFKGSTAVDTCVTCTQSHVDNHLQWLKVAASVSAAVNLKGIAITGWQRLDSCFHHKLLMNLKLSSGPAPVRYDHLSVLCELMPVALPSLASCLQTLIHGHFGHEAGSRVKELLGVSSVEVEAMER